MNVVFSVCIVRRGAVGARGCVLHDLQFVNAGRGCNRRPYTYTWLEQILDQVKVSK